MKKCIGPFGFSCESLKKVYEKDNSYGAYITLDSKVYIGFVIYFHKWCLAIWVSRYSKDVFGGEL